MAIGDKRWKAVLLVISIFVLGLITGAVTSNLMSTASEEQLMPWQKHENSEQLMQQLTKELNLMPEQSEAIRQILTETREDYSRLRQEVHPRFQEIRHRSRDRIRAILNPEQREKFEELVRRHDAEMKNRWEKKD